MSYLDKNRLFRALNERMYVLSAHKGTVNWLFFVMGSTGKVYKLVFTKKTIECSCPDYGNHQSHCKHIYFVIFRVLKVGKEDWDGRWDLILSTKMGKLMSHRKEMKEKRKRLLEDTSVQEKNNKRPKVEEDEKCTKDCRICLEPLLPEEKSCWTCSICKNTVSHLKCANEWFIRGCGYTREATPRCPNCNLNINDPEHIDFTMQLHESPYDPFLRLNHFTKFENKI